MFKRLVLEDWQHTLPYIGFGLFFTIFVVVVIWTLRMKKEKVDRLARLPLENDNLFILHPETLTCLTLKKIEGIPAIQT